jgi:hypothetical protein
LELICFELFKAIRNFLINNIGDEIESMLNQVLSNQHGSVFTYIEGIHFVTTRGVYLPPWPVEKGAQVILDVKYFVLILVPNKSSTSREKELLAFKVVLDL